MVIALVILNIDIKPHWKLIAVLVCSCVVLFLGAVICSCPHCGGYLYRISSDYCPHCGKNVYQDNTGYYVVISIEGDKVKLDRADVPEECIIEVDRSLLPKEIRVGTKLKGKNDQFWIA
jgi:RNA polymerase subunit RPABC4/transcription elongation factor Spt4